MNEPRSTRNRGERPPKRRSSTPPPPKVSSRKRKVTSVQSPAQPDLVEEGLPTKLKDGHPLPTLTEPLNRETRYQSISESGVLAASLERSRQKWLAQGVFEKYWTKPSKKKNSQDVQNPAKDSMVKLGMCSMIIQPHVFETMLYTLKEQQLTFLPPIGHSLPPQTSQYGHPYNPKTYQTPHYQSQGFAGSNQQYPAHQSGKYAQQATSQTVYTPNPGISTPQPPTGPGISQEAAINNEQGSNGKQTDPVIQMLATKAATDHDLKSLMRVVASGQASQTQLRVFQNHIDELNGIILSRNDNSPSLPKGRTSPNQTQLTAPVASQAETERPPPNAQQPSYSHGPPNVSNPTTHIPPVKTEQLSQYYSHPPPPLKAKGTNLRGVDSSGVVFEFTAGNGDRYLFPRYSILEYLPGGTQVVASFLVTRKGNINTSRAYKDTTIYYQPVTVRLSSHNPRILEPLARIVAPPDEVRRYMNDVMDKMAPARKVDLVMQLPRPDGDCETENTEITETVKDQSRNPLFSPPDFHPPLYHKALKKVTIGT